MTDQAGLHAELQALAEYLSQRREEILRAWHDSLATDPELAAFSSLSRAQFNDHIPAVLRGFEHRLRTADSPDEGRAAALENVSAAEHGLHRWQQGYDQRQTMREWGHLQQCLLAEFEQFSASQPQLAQRVMPIARRALARMCSDGVIESGTRYLRLQQAEAASRLRDLEQAVRELQLLEQQRAEGWRQAAHDLRGSVGVISNASVLLNRNLSEPQRTQFSQILQRGVSTLHTLLSDLIDVARLEAGQERRRISQFDVAQVLRDLCETMRNVAAERNLFLLSQGAESLAVFGDRAKVLRIAQNLMLNGLKATQQGGVRVVWETRETHWLLSVQDTGPGFTRGSAAPLEDQLQRATIESHAVDAAGAGPTPEPAATLDSQSGHQPPSALAGEGIGLSIVKRLCELLDASLELETEPGAGTTFRVSFPRAYPKDAYE
ncbi:MAG TPA: sensor histidine kinase [Vicinamibacterales bacterium]|jgi:signal transduction histidine kinase